MLTGEIVPVTESNGQVLIAIKGFQPFRDEVEQNIDATRQLFIKATCHGLEVGRLINEFSASKELKAEVDALNAKRKANGDGGRPVEYHCYVAKLLVRTGIGVSKEWLEKCARAEKRAKALGYKVKDVNLLSVQTRDTETVHKLPLPNGNATLHTPPSKIEDEFPRPIDEVLPTPESVFPVAPETSKPTPPKKFSDFVASFVTRLDALKSNTGEVALRSKRNQETLSDAITTWFHDQGVEIDIHFKK